MTERLHNKEITKKIQRLNNSGPLIPENIELLRDQIPVVDSLIIKSHPLADNEINLQKIDTTTNEFEKFQKLTQTHTHYKYESNKKNSVSLIDKIYPHGLFEIMLMQSGNIAQPSIFELGEHLENFSLNAIKEFSNYAQKQDLYPYIAWNYDPNTTDRQSGQGVKRFHMHFIGRTKQELDFINTNQKQIKDLKPIRARRLVDETSIIGSYILFDILKKQKFDTIEYFEPFSHELPQAPNLMLKLKNNWQTTSDKKFKFDFQQIHVNFIKTYQDIMNCIWEGQNGNWLRPNIRNKNQICDLLNNLQYLKAKTKESILYIINKIQPSLLTKTILLSQKKFKDITTHIYPSNGPCYSTSICEIKDSVYCTIRPYMFSDLGGAGLCNPHGIVTKIKKGNNNMNQKEIAERSQFQKEFIKQLQKTL